MREWLIIMGLFWPLQGLPKGLVSPILGHRDRRHQKTRLDSSV